LPEYQKGYTLRKMIVGPNNSASPTNENELVVNDDGSIVVVVTGRNVKGEVTVPNGGTVPTTGATGYWNLEGRHLTGIHIPASYDGGNITLEAALTQASATAGTFFDVYDSGGTLVTLTVAGASRIVSLTSTHAQAVTPLQYVRPKCASAVGGNYVLTAVQKG